MKKEKFLGKTISKKDADKDSFEDVTNYITEKMYSEEEPYTNVQQKSLELNKQFVNSMDSESLDNIMSEFDEPKQQTAIEWLEDCLTEQHPNEPFVWNTRADLEALFKQAKEMEKQQQGYSEEDLNKHVIEFLEWREKYFAMYHGNKNRGLYYANRAYGNPYYNEDRHTALTRKYYNLHELLELFNKFKNK